MKPSFKAKLYNFEIPRLDIGTLMNKAINHYNGKYHESVTLDKLPEKKLNHIILNFIRHRLIADYDRNYSCPSFEKDPAEYFAWFKAINHEIGQTYPFLIEVVKIQIANKGRQIFQPKEISNG